MRGRAWTALALGLAAVVLAGAVWLAAALWAAFVAGAELLQWALSVLGGAL